MAIPERIDARQLSDYLEVMSMAIFQAGMRWSVVDAKWPAFKRAFANFDPQKVASFTKKDIQKLADEPSIVRSCKKIEGTVENARTLLELDAEYGGFKNYLHSFSGYDELSSDLKRRFRFMGDLNAYYFLFRVKEPVPPFDEWIKTIPGEHPRMREMVQLAAEQDRRRQAG